MRLYILLMGISLFSGIVLADEGQQYTYNHQLNGDITEKPLRSKVIISTFTAVDIPESPFNAIKEEGKDPTKDINIKIDDALAVLAAKNIQQEKYTEGDMLVGLLSDKLRKIDFFDVIERQNINELMREIDFEHSKWVKQSDINKAGDFSGAQYIVLGKLLMNKHHQYVGPDNFLLTLRICNINTGEILATSTGQHDSLEGVVDEAVRKIAKSVHTSAWTARVAKTDKGAIFINAGFGDNLKKGLTFLIIRPGEEILDPSTKKLLGVTSTEIAKVRIDEVLEESLSKAKIINQKEDIHVGDIVSARAPNQKIDEMQRWNEIEQESHH